MKRWWWYPASGLTKPWWPLIWRGGDEWGRATICLTVPGIGALIMPYTRPNPELMNEPERLEYQARKTKRASDGE